MFTKKKKKPQISTPTNFEHRVHTGFDKREGKFVGLPLQWASIVGNNQILKSTNRPLPLVDPSEITPTEILDLKTIVRGHNDPRINRPLATEKTVENGLPKTSTVARSNSLRSSSPPRLRKDYRCCKTSFAFFLFILFTCKYILHVYCSMYLRWKEIKKKIFLTGITAIFRHLCQKVKKYLQILIKALQTLANCIITLTS